MTDTNVEIDDEEAVTAARVEEVINEEDTELHKKPPTIIPPSLTSTQTSDSQEHPYQRAKDAVYTPWPPRMWECKISQSHWQSRWQRSGHSSKSSTLSKNWRGYKWRRHRIAQVTPHHYSPIFDFYTDFQSSRTPLPTSKRCCVHSPTTKNVGVQDKPIPLTIKKPKPAYRTLPPIHDTIIAYSIYKQSMETLIMITQKELLSLSPEVRSQYRDCTTTWWIPNKDIPTTQDCSKRQKPTTKQKLLFPSF